MQTESITSQVEYLRKVYTSGKTKTLAYRKQQLAGIAAFLKEREKDIEAALFQDLRKPAMESFVAEIAFVQTELKYTQKHLASWMKSAKVPGILPLLPASCRIQPEPLGVVLIIAPWNYPIQLALAPLIGALAAGNVAVLKPSELAPACSRLLATQLPKYLDADCLSVIEGGVTETTALLSESLDHIFFTGSPRVGRVVMEAAAKLLTPVTLELGGKCPCVIDKTANLDVAAKRIVWAKFSNAGQSCVAPDYLLVEKDIEQALLEKMKLAIQAFYGDDPQASPDLARIINQQHHQRLVQLLHAGGHLFVGGNADESDCYIDPTIMTGVTTDSPIMQDEIFGPILPVISISSLEEAVHIINSRAKPLAAYLFSSLTQAHAQFIALTSSGGVSINHAMLQLAVPSLPFGGVGQSGMGSYHGKASFDTFTHYKSVFSKPTWFDLSAFYPPYNEKLKKYLRIFM